MSGSSPAGQRAAKIKEIITATGCRNVDMEPCHAKSLHSFSIIKSLPDLQHFAGYIERELLTNTNPIKYASVSVVKQPDPNRKEFPRLQHGASFAFNSANWPLKGRVRHQP